jgi:hypothetical protein
LRHESILSQLDIQLDSHCEQSNDVCGTIPFRGYLFGGRGGGIISLTDNGRPSLTGCGGFGGASTEQQNASNDAFSTLSDDKEWFKCSIKPVLKGTGGGVAKFVDSSISFSRGDNGISGKELLCGELFVRLLLGITIESGLRDVNRFNVFDDWHEEPLGVIFLFGSLLTTDSLFW